MLASSREPATADLPGRCKHRPLQPTPHDIRKINRNKKGAHHDPFQQTAGCPARGGQHARPGFQIGKGEIDETLIDGVAKCLAARELIKCKVLDNSEYAPREAADILAEADRRGLRAGDWAQVRTFQAEGQGQRFTALLAAASK